MLDRRAYARMRRHELPTIGTPHVGSEDWHEFDLSSFRASLVSRLWGLARFLQWSRDMNAKPLKHLLSALLPALLGGCAGTAAPDAVPAREMLDVLPAQVSIRDQAFDPTAFDPEVLRSSSPAETTTEYSIGPSDVLRVHVVGHPDLTGEFTVGPDGCIGMFLIGTVMLRGLSRTEGANQIATQLEPFLQTAPVVTIDVRSYQNNKVFVLGRVEEPGIVELTGSGTLLQALSEAGGLPVREFRAFLSRAAIIRGSEQILWIDLSDLLQSGNVALNIPLQNGDVVYIPDSEDSTVFVMGSVETPGAIPIKARIHLAQVLSKAGGPNEDADLTKIFVLRPTRDGTPIQPMHVDFRHLLETGDFTENIEILAGDIIYVARSGMGDLNYVLRKLAPGVAVVGTAAIIGG